MILTVLVVVLVPVSLCEETISSSNRAPVQIALLKPAPFVGYPEVPAVELSPLVSAIKPAPFGGYPAVPAVELSPLVSALLFSTALGVPAKPPGFNHPEHVPPVNPYIALLLSQYGRYIAVPGATKGLYGYGAANNYHNNKPFGSYKIYEDADG